MPRPRILKDEADYERALSHVESLMDARAGTARGDALELWTYLIERYEEQHHPIGPPDPIQAIKFRMEQRGMKPADLVPLLGSRSRVSEVLRGKRPLSLAMIRALYQELGIPAEVLIRAGAA